MEHYANETQPFAADHLDAAASLYVSIFNGPPWNQTWTVPKARSYLAETLTLPGAQGVVLLSDHLLGFILGRIREWYDGPVFSIACWCYEGGMLASQRMLQMFERLEQTLREQLVERVYHFSASPVVGEENLLHRGYQRREARSYTRTL